jgi:hypothetical protein
MLERISSPIAIVAALVVSGISLDLQANTAHAIDCLAAPNASPPQGQHWYYRIDRPNHRKCWYLHATLPLSHRAVIKRAERYGPSAKAGVAMSGSLADSASRLPYLGTPAGKLQPALIVRATSEEPSPPIAPEEGDAPSIPSESSADSLRPDGDAYISDDAEGAAEGSLPTGKAGAAGALRLILLLVPALAVAGFLIPVVIKMVSERPVDVPETAWIDYRFVHERPGPRGQHQRRDHRHGFGFVDPRSREQSAGQEEGTKESASVSTRRSKTRSQYLAATSAKPLRPNWEGIERALRVIRQARQQHTA